MVVFSVLSFLLAGSGCSLMTTEYITCTDSSECQDAFGLGYVCAEDGLCAETAQHPRCESLIPDDLLIRPEDYPGVTLIGMLGHIEHDAVDVAAAGLAFSQAWDLGGIDGQQVAIVNCGYQEDSSIDGLVETDAAIEVARYLVDGLGASGLIVPTSSISKAVYNAVIENDGSDVLIMSPSATSPELSTIDGSNKSDQDPGLFWRTCWPDDLQGFVAASDIRDRGKSEVAVIWQEGPYGEGLKDSFLLYFKDPQHNVYWKDFSFSNTTEQVSAVSAVGDSIDSDGNLIYDEVFFIADNVTDVIGMLNAAILYESYTKRKERYIFLADGASDIQLLKQTPQASILYDLIRGTRPAVPSSNVYNAFAASYFSELGVNADDSIYSAYAYDAAWLTIYGVAWAQFQEQTVSGTEIARGLRQLSSGQDIEVRASGFEQVLTAFAGGSSVDLVGASGELDYDPATEETTGPIDIWQVNKNGDGFDVVETITP